MKRIIVGRGSDCDIIIQDTTDTVSRHHLVISINFFGKMTISDTSSNGTSVNGRKITKGVSLPVSREDTVRLGDATDLDWNRIEDPYSKTRKLTLIGLILIALVAIGFLIGGIVGQKRAENNMFEMSVGACEEESGEWNKDSTENVAPVETSIETGRTQPAQKKAARPASNRKKSGSKKVNKSKGNGNAARPINEHKKSNRINDADKRIAPEPSPRMRNRDHSNEKDK